MDSNANTEEKNEINTGAAPRLPIKAIFSFVIAAVMFAVVFTAFYKNEKADNRDYTPSIVIMGDSIMAYYQDERSVASKLSELTGEEVLDASFGGTCFSYQDRDGRLDNCVDAFSIAALTQAIVSNDFRYQYTSDVRMSATEYFPERVKQLGKVDFSGVDILIIESLANDYHNSARIKSGSDKYDEYTYEGAMRSVIEVLKKNYPDLRIIIAAPPETFYRDADGNMISCMEKDFGGGTEKDYLDAQRKIASEYGIELLDLSGSYGEINEENWNDYSIDGLHPWPWGAEKIAECIAGYIGAD